MKLFKHAAAAGLVTIAVVSAGALTPGAAYASTVYTTHAGQKIYMDSNFDRKLDSDCTLGAIVKLDGRTYGVTVRHCVPFVGQGVYGVNGKTLYRVGVVTQVFKHYDISLIDMGLGSPQKSTISNVYPLTSITEKIRISKRGVTTGYTSGYLPPQKLHPCGDKFVLKQRIGIFLQGGLNCWEGQLFSRPGDSGAGIVAESGPHTGSTVGILTGGVDGKVVVSPISIVFGKVPEHP